MWLCFLYRSQKNISRITGGVRGKRGRGRGRGVTAKALLHGAHEATHLLDGGVHAGRRALLQLHLPDHGDIPWVRHSSTRAPGWGWDQWAAWRVRASQL